MVKLANPNDREIAVDAVDAELRLEDMAVGTAALAAPVRVPPRGEVTASVIAKRGPRVVAARERTRSREGAPRRSARRRRCGTACQRRGDARRRQHDSLLARRRVRARGDGTYPVTPQVHQDAGPRQRFRRARRRAPARRRSTRRRSARSPTGASASAATRCSSSSPRKATPTSATASSTPTAARSSSAATARAASSCSCATMA